MSFLNRIVDKVYVINLDKDTARMEAISAQLKSHGIEFTRIPAVLGSTVKRSPYLTDFCERFCTDGMKGCAISHRLIWEDMLENQYRRILVFEDDAILSPQFNQELERAWGQLPDDFDVFYLGCNFKCTDTYPVPKLINKITNSTPEVVDDNILSVNGSFGTHAYMLSRKGAKVFQSLPINTHIDLQMEIWTTKFQLNAYSINPVIVTTTGNDGGNGSNLSEAFPYLLNTVLRQIPFSDSITLDWGLSENFAKIGPFNINGLLSIVTLLVLLLPAWTFPAFLLWMLVEFAASWDFKNTVKFLTFMGAAAGLRYSMGRVLRLKRLV
jgi:GR25 family glycosyltransferase involved in LPS biosynthesis